ncbi:hypothetical protein [Kosakonia sacchari]|uniref:hypothetical protein n=1 Tax=Kosakonia sacchari TaxID=1158459 RepID=UPI0015859CCE|nr:hypothetical protein [Kosakonia sacchari]NUL36658.1 hypothetical protein [Kosakonia sacchari]
MSDSRQKNIPILNNVIESNNYVETCADGAVIIAAKDDGNDFYTLVFLNSSPVIESMNQTVTVRGIQRRKVASITLSKRKAEIFFNSLKKSLGE